jgi:hypothetical protein
MDKVIFLLRPNIHVWVERLRVDLNKVGYTNDPVLNECVSERIAQCGHIGVTVLGSTKGYIRCRPCSLAPECLVFAH